MIVSVFMLTAVGVVVNKYFIVPRLGKYDPANGEAGAADASGEITPIQAGALRAAGIFSIAYIALLAILTVPKTAFSGAKMALF